MRGGFQKHKGIHLPHGSEIEILTRHQFLKVNNIMCDGL